MDFKKIIEYICEGLPQDRIQLIQAVIEESYQFRVDLEKDLEKATKLQTTTVEKFKQERFCLKNKIEMMSKMETHYMEEVSSLQEQLQNLISRSSDSKQHEAEITKYKLKIESLTSQLDSQQDSEKDLQGKLEEVEKRFAEYKEEQENLSNQKSMMISEDYLQLQAQVTTLQENTETLEAQLKASDNHVKALMTEKEALNSLLLSQTEDNEQMRCKISSYSNGLEEFKQERFCLKNKIEMMSKMETHYMEEVSSLQEQLQNLNSRSSDSKQHEAEITKYKLKIESLTYQLDSQQDSEKDLQGKLEEVEKRFAEYKEEQENLSNQKSMMISEDYLQLQAQVTTLQENTETLEAQLKASDNHVKALMTEKEALKSSLLSQTEDNEQMRCKISSYSNGLERCREENLEYKVLLENMQMENTVHGEKGNSLFGELDDRRVQAEKNLVSYQAQVKTLTQRLHKEKQQHHKVKIQMTTLLHSNSDSVSKESYNRSDAMISKLKTEKVALLNKIKHLETLQKEMTGKLLELQENPPAEGGEGKQDNMFTHFLTALVRTREEEINGLKEEIHQYNMKMLHKDDTIIEANRKIFKLESEVEKAWKKSVKQNLRIEELEMKYELESTEAVVKQGKTEKIPMKLEDCPDFDKSARFVLKESIQPTSSDSRTQVHKKDNLCHRKDNDSLAADIKSESLNNTEVTPLEDSALGLSALHPKRQVMISSEGEIEHAALNEESQKKNENVRVSKKSRVHHNVKIVTSNQLTGVDPSQCKQQ